MNEIFAIGLGGFLGAIARYGLSRYVNQYVSQFPLGTLSVNVIGSLILGFVGYSIIYGKNISPELRGFISIGFIGAFTTMSTFAFETTRLWDVGHHWISMVNIAANVFLCLLAIVAGKGIAMAMFR